jgi:hypothetical protein
MSIFKQKLRMRYLTLFFLALALGSCEDTSPSDISYSVQKANEQQSHLIHQLNHALIGVVSEDLFPPPVASRIYAYSNIAAFEAVRPLQANLPSLAGTLNELQELPASEDPLYWEIAMISSYCEVAKHLVYRDHLVDSTLQRMIDTLRPQYPRQDIFQQSLNMGLQTAEHIKAWADQDGYNATRNMPKYEPLKEDFAWEATQPTYGEALEPHWFRLRPFLMDSASQFRVEVPIAYDERPGSPFYQAAEEVYQIVNAAKEEDIAVAVYWDCNPGPTMVEGHVMKVRKQNTPGGHWIGIHSIVNKKSDKTLAETCLQYAKLSIGMADGFIAAWDTKYAHHLLRPETFINRHIDPDWLPKLESPLFPEFTSAHSLISAVAASILEKGYGNVAFYDDTNVMFGLPPKSFNNFWEAAEEAAQSRLLGGIHYTFACDLGFEQGKELGVLVNSKIQ